MVGNKKNFEKNMLIFVFFSFFLFPLNLIPKNISSYGAIDSPIKSISINSSFKGTEVNIYGVCKKNKPKIISILSGPKKNVFINKKIKKYGMWIHNEQNKILNADLVYLVSSNISMPIIENSISLGKLMLDAKNINYSMEKKLSAKQEKELINAFKQTRANLKLFDNVVGSFEFIDTEKEFFKITYLLPKETPEGEYNVKINFIANGSIKNTIETSISIKSDKIYSLIYKIAKGYPFIYGAICSSASMLIGFIIFNVLKSPVNI